MKHLPNSAFELYRHLCLKKHNFKKGQKCKIVKSWNVLSDSERQHFIEKFNEYKTKCKKTFANYLQNTEPYMKKRENTGIPEICNNDTTESQEILSENVDNGIITKQTIFDAAHESYNNININTSQHPEYSQTDRHMELYLENEMQLQTEIQPQTEIQLQTELQQETDSIEIQSSTTRAQLEQTICLLTEPTPPSVKNAKELFEALTSPAAEVDAAWSSLPQKQKNRYGHATLALKKDYIKQYKSYLESLTSEQLFNYYIKKTM